jgi:hypothetical protein
MRPNLRLLAPVLLTATLAACGSDTVAPDANPLPPLAAATWHVHAAEGQSLPALVAHRLDAGVLVQDFLDSAQFRITADGRWERRLWMSRYRDFAYASAVPSQEVGTWTATDTAYAFVAEPSGRRFSLRSLTPGQVAQVPLRAANEGYIEATLRTDATEPSIVGTYRVTEVRGQPAPAPIYVFNDYPEDGRLKSIHFIVDSAHVQLAGNGRYSHRIHFTEWEGPNGGSPERVRVRWMHADHGTWTRDGTLLRFESGWLQNHRFNGTTYDAQRMELLHGLSHGDPPVPVRYARE